MSAQLPKHAACCVHQLFSSGIQGYEFESSATDWTQMLSSSEPFSLQIADINHAEVGVFSIG